MPAANSSAPIVANTPHKESGNSIGERKAKAESSRSTSAESMCSTPSSPECSHLPDAFAIQGNALPGFEYPAPFTVRNTFIDTGIVRPLSLEEFYEERRVHSEPVDVPRKLSIEDVEDLTLAAQFHQAMALSHSMRASAAAAALAASEATAAAMSYWMPAVSCWPQSNPVNVEVVSQAPIIRLADSLVEPTVGSAQLPTVGSAGHASGSCKPCAFFHTRGCGNGTDCVFCHLCPPGEKKRRQKDKIAMLREMRSMGMQV